jgi:hypothetical protein
MGGRGSRGRALPQAGYGPGARTAAEKTNDAIRAAYNDLAPRPGELVSLARLRDSLPEVARDDLDAVLLAMDRNRELQLEPDPHRIALTQRAKDAAIQLGGEAMHLIVMLPPPEKS